MDLFDFFCQELDETTDTNPRVWTKNESQNPSTMRKEPAWLYQLSPLNHINWRYISRLFNNFINNMTRVGFLVQWFATRGTCTPGSASASRGALGKIEEKLV